MKKSKILVLSLCIALLACMAFAFNSAAAEEEGNVAILSKNVSYSSNIEMLFAVDATLEEADDVVVTYYFESAPDVIYTASLNDVANPDTVFTDAEGVKHPSFSTIGIPAKEYGEKVYVAAQMKGAAAEAEYVEYSVAEYFYEKLFAGEYIYATEGADYNRKDLYLSYLRCGAAAQNVLINDKHPDKAETVVTKYNYVALGNGVAGAESGFYADGESLTLTYGGTAPANKQFSGWQIAKFDGLDATAEYSELSESSCTITVDGIYIVAPAFIDALPGGNGAYYNAYKNSAIGGTMLDFSSETDASIGSSFASFNGGAYCTLSILSDAKYVRYEKTTDYASNIQRALRFTAADESTNATVIEMDLRIGGVAAGTSFFSVITVDNRGFRRDIYLNCDRNGMIQFRNSENHETAEGYVGLNTDQWYNVRIVISADQNANSTESGVAEIYINNEFACKTTLFGRGTNSGSDIVLQLRSSSSIGAYMEFDNVYVGHIVNE